MSLRSEIETQIASAAVRALEEGLHRSYLTDTSESLAAEVARCCGTERCQLFSSATAGLETVLRTVIKQPSDYVVLSGYDYPGNFWAIERAGGRPLLLDIAPDGWCIKPEELEKALASGREIKAVVVSFLHGDAPEIFGLRDVCDQHGVLLIEDACQAFGGRLTRLGKVHPCGSIGHVGLVSFGGGKVVSAGRGGAVVTRDDRIAQRILVASGAGSGAYALSEIQAAIVQAQLPFIDRVNQVVQNTFEALVSCLPADLQATAPWAQANGQSQVQCVDRAFYQAGFLLPSNEHVKACERRLTLLGLRSGGGFAGFHRRSNRRCERLSQLTHAQLASERTLTIHHAVAFSTVTVDEAAEAIQEAFAELD